MQSSSWLPVQLELDSPVIPEADRLLRDSQQPPKQRAALLRFDHHWFPPSWESFESETDASTSRDQEMQKIPRSLRRRFFLVLTEPESSIASALFFLFLVVAISLMNIVMVMQTMDSFQYTPTDCTTCGGTVSYLFDNEKKRPFTNSCQCPPTPLPWTEEFLKYTIYFFSVEWILRILSFVPQAPMNQFQQWLEFVFTPSTVLDALAIFPYYIGQFDTNGLMSLRLIRLFQVFQLVRLGTYNDTFKSLTTVLKQSLPFLKLLLGVLFFGAAFFGSIVYWLEKGYWTYYSATESFQFVRMDHAGRETISPFHSIPAAFWWFFVTATTVGYGDVYPTTAAGKWVATLAMLTGVLVVAFPVSVFSELWSKELRKAGFSELMASEDDSDEERAGPVENGRSERFLYSAVFANESYQKSRNHEDNKEVNNQHEPSCPRNRHQREKVSPVPRSGTIVMDADDYYEIMAQMQSIHESQMYIRSILRKYKTSNATNGLNKDSAQV